MPAVPINKEMVEDILMLTPMQESMLFHYLANEESTVYCDQVGLELVGPLDLPAFYQAWKKVVEGNEMLRTVIRWNQEHKAVQIIKRDHAIPITELDLSKELVADLPAILRTLREERQKDRISISEAPIRILLCKLAADQYELHMDYHHIIVDGWSLGVMMQEFLASYHALVNGKSFSIHKKTSYKSYVKWLHEQDKSVDESYWRTYLYGMEQRSIIPHDHPKLAETGLAGLVPCSFGEVLTKQLLHFCAERQLSIASLICGAWGLLLQKYNNTNDVCFGVTISGRPPEIMGIEDMVGLFIQTLPMRLISGPKDTELDYLKQAASDLAGKDIHASIPLRDFAAFSQMGEGALLFDSVVVIKNYSLELSGNEEQQGLQLRKSHVQEETNFDLTLQVSVHDAIHIDFHYNGQLYEQPTIEGLVIHYKRIITEIMKQGNRLVAELELVTAEEKKGIGQLFHNTEVELIEQTIPELVWSHAEQLPDHVAVRFEDRVLTYGQLREDARRISFLLKENGVSEKGRVALYVPRSVEMIAGVLGILEAGCVCVPLDLSHPAERTLAILEDCDAEAMLVMDEQHSLGFKGKVLSIVSERLPSYANVESSPPISAHSTAFMIYTSGSTGKPKGAMLHHYGIVNHVYAKMDELDIGKNDIVGNSFSINVVASIWQILAPLFAGAELVVYSEEVERDPLEQFKSIEQDGVTIIEVIPSVLNAYVRLLQAGHPVIPLTRLKAIALTSEETKPVLVNLFYRYYQIQLVNVYGQTECCDDTLHYRIPMDTDTRRVLIGRPIRNMRPYILDRNEVLQPLGLIGELWVAGVGVSHGYWNRPEMNRDKFVEHPLEPGRTMYRTGDLATWLPDGNIRYLGRVDHQVKIRGNRIELNEVENGLARLPELREVAVILRSNARSEEVLWAFFTASVPMTVSGMRGDLQDILPKHMIPELFVQLSEMPLMANGKINRHALRAMESGMLSTGNDAAGPDGELETWILEIWKNTLRKNEISVHDSFFDAGGNSLLILELATQLNDAFKVKLTVANLFAYSTIRKQASFISDMTQQREMKPKVTVRSIRLEEENFAAPDSVGSMQFEAEVPEKVWTLLNQAKVRKELQVGDLAFTALALLLHKVSGQDEITLYKLHSYENKIQPFQFDFRKISDVAELLKEYMYQLGSEEQWRSPEDFLLSAEEARLSVRSLVTFHKEGQHNAAMSGLSTIFNLQITWTENGTDPDRAAVMWHLHSGGLDRDQVKEWLSAHIKLIVYAAEHLENIEYLKPEVML